MSRTFAHRPYWVHHQDPSVLLAVHDHREGPCDLRSVADAFVDTRAEGVSYSRGRCYWDLDLYAVGRTCGCRMCTAHCERREDRRRSRHEARRELRRWVEA